MSRNFFGREEKPALNGAKAPFTLIVNPAVVTSPVTPVPMQGPQQTPLVPLRDPASNASANTALGWSAARPTPTHQTRALASAAAPSAQPLLPPSREVDVPVALQAKPGSQFAPAHSPPNQQQPPQQPVRRVQAPANNSFAPPHVRLGANQQLCPAPGPAVSAPTSPAGTVSGERMRGGPAVRPALAHPQPQVAQEAQELAAQDATMRSIGVLLGRMRHAGQIRIKFSFGGETRYLLEHSSTLHRTYVLCHRHIRLLTGPSRSRSRWRSPTSRAPSSSASTGR